MMVTGPRGGWEGGEKAMTLPSGCVLEVELTGHTAGPRVIKIKNHDDSGSKLSISMLRDA